MVWSATLHGRNGNYGLIEIKLGGEKNIEEGAKNLRSLASKIDTTKMKAPSFLMVLTGPSRYAIRREDGVYVVPHRMFEGLMMVNVRLHARTCVL